MAGAVGRIGADLVGPGAWAAPPQARHSDPGHDRLELWAVAALARGDHHRQRPLATLDRQVQLGGQPTPGPPQAMVGRLEVHPARLFVLAFPRLRAPAAC
jgi:hypothetical protein